MEGTTCDNNCGIPNIFIGTSTTTNDVLFEAPTISHSLRQVSSTSSEEEYNIKECKSRKHSNMMDFSQMIRAEIFKAVNSNCEDENIVDRRLQDPMMRTRKVNLVAQLQHYFKDDTIYMNDHSEDTPNTVGILLKL
uniref:BESS domain-containing protein n=1 Tax=Strongyloides stercoralis TaxID=6248 RepID=A0A0K0EJS0_STRER